MNQSKIERVLARIDLALSIRENKKPTGGLVVIHPAGFDFIVDDCPRSNSGHNLINVATDGDAHKKELCLNCRELLISNTYSEGWDD